jgi:succinate dehydrogenase/fumarate reductase cytochrome b subunit
MATTPPASSPFNTFVGKVESAIINPLITVVALAAFILFIYGVFEFIQGADNDEKRKLGQIHIIWGLIGLTIMFGARTIVAVLTRVVA